MAGIEDDAGARPDERGRHIRDLLLGPAIHPDQAGRERPAVGIDGNAAVELAADAERRDLLRRGARLAQRAGDRRPERALPQRRILLRPARPRELRPIGRCRLAANPEFAVGDRDLQALRADIDADDH